MATTNLELFSQASTQVNMLLLSQRNMVLVTAFAITLQTFSKNFKYIYIRYLSFLLFIFAIASGSKSVQDFNAYVEDVLEDSNTQGAERDLIKRWSKWADYSYFMLAIVAFILVNIIIIELSNFSGFGWTWEHQKGVKKNKKVN